MNEVLFLELQVAKNYVGKGGKGGTWREDIY